MSCPIILNGIALDCKNQGGIKEIYAIDRSNISDVTFSGATGIISVITTVESKKFSVYKLRSEVGVMESTINSDDSAGTLSYTTSVTANFSKMTAAKRLEIQAMAQGDMAVIVKDNNGSYWYMGYDWPVTLTEGGASTGTALTDSNQYTVTLTDKGKYLPFEVDSGIIAGLIS